MPAPLITTTVANALLIYSGAANTSASWTAPGLMAEQWERSTSGSYKVSNEVATQGLSNSGATGTQTASLSTSAKTVAISIAIAPSP